MHSLDRRVGGYAYQGSGLENIQISKKNIGRPARLINQSYCSSIICIDDRISVTSNIFLDFQLNGFNYKKNLKQGNLIIKVMTHLYLLYVFIQQVMIS